MYDVDAVITDEGGVKECKLFLRNGPVLGGELFAVGNTDQFSAHCEQVVLVLDLKGSGWAKSGWILHTPELFACSRIEGRVVSHADDEFSSNELRRHSGAESMIGAFHDLAPDTVSRQVVFGDDTHAVAGVDEFTIGAVRHGCIAIGIVGLRPDKLLGDRTSLLFKFLLLGFGFLQLSL